MMELDFPKSRMPLGFNEDDIAFSKLYKCVIVGGQKTMTDVVHAMYQHPLVNSEGGTMLLKDYFAKVLHWNSNKIKSKIGEIQQPLLKDDLMTQELDISSACKLMEEACFNIYNELSNDCRNHIKTLKKLRNKISHKYGCIGKDVASEIDTLKVLLRDIYEGVGTVLEKDFTDNISGMEKILTDIRDAQVHPRDIASQEEDIQNFKKDRIHKLITSGRKELEEDYRRLRVLNPCTWMMGEEVSKSSVDKFYVEKIFTPLRTEDSRNNIDIKDIFNVKVQAYDDCKLPPALLVYGLAGCGKSSLCYFLLHDWYLKKKEVLSLSDFDLVLFVSVRTVKSSRLVEYLMQQLLLKTTRDFESSDHIIPLLQELDILFIIDGFDEANVISHKVIEEIFAKFGDQRIILTTRPEFHRDAALLLKKHQVDCLSIEICGFDDQSTKDFIKKVFNAVEENPEKCKKQIAEFSEYIRRKGKVLSSQLRLPLTLALLIYLWRDNPEALNRVTTSTCLYYELFELVQMKLLERLNCFYKDRILEDLLLFLGEQAWDLLQSGNINISDEVKQKIEKECITKEIDETEFMSAFLMCDVREKEDSLQRDYAFLHKTQMEYLAAAFLATKVKMNKNFTCINVLNNWRRYHEVIIFLTGHLAKKQILKTHVDDLIELIEQAEVQSINFNFWWMLFVESLNHFTIGKIIAKRKLPVEDWHLDDTHLVAGLNLLIKTNVMLKTLKIEIANGIEPYEIPDFFDIMKTMRNELKNRYGKQKPILVELHFWRHNEYDFHRPSDEFLRTLNPWGHLVNFTGGLGEQREDKEVLSYCFKLKTIRIRIMTAGALRSFSNSLSKIYKSVRQIRLTLALPPTCATEHLANLCFKGNLEITVENIQDENIQWFVNVVEKVGGRPLAEGNQHSVSQRQLGSRIIQKRRKQFCNCESLCFTLIHGAWFE
ncbi:uncharacterized protein [Panulirus ornatus]|uniref:uncharacterized protein isoform X2 n=1 Tax=Panulirus ornatus TaxID=150431 RepID=UPI003A851C60